MNQHGLMPSVDDSFSPARAIRRNRGRGHAIESPVLSLYRPSSHTAYAAMGALLVCSQSWLAPTGGAQ